MAGRKGGGPRKGQPNRARSAISGRYVTKQHARSSPRTTVVESTKKG